MDDDRQDVHELMTRVLKRMLETSDDPGFWFEYMTTNALPAWIRKLSDVPTGQIPSAEDESFESLVAGICLNARAASDLNEATQLTVRTLEDDEFWAELSVGRDQNVIVERICGQSKPVAVDTNEECETASQAHTGTKK